MTMFCCKTPISFKRASAKPTIIKEADNPPETWRHASKSPSDAVHGCSFQFTRCGTPTRWLVCDEVS